LLINIYIGLVDLGWIRHIDNNLDGFSE